MRGSGTTRGAAVRRATVATTATTATVVLMLSLKPHHAPASAAAPGARHTSGQHTSGQHPPAGTSGTYTGRTVDTRYGPVQLRVTFSGGKLTKITALRLPSANGTDRAKAAHSVPRLTREALTAQSATIDTVSGATYTSEGYRQSLQSALDAAGTKR